MINRAAAKAKPAYELIREKVKTCKTNGGDETGMKINGQKGWFWTLQSKAVTLIIASLMS